MKLDGIHHITAITADAQENVDFYAGRLGLRLVKKTVNQDNPTVYHLFYADEKGTRLGPHVLRVPGIPQGRAGDGMVYRSSGEWGRGRARFLDERLGGRRGRRTVATDPRSLSRSRGARARAARFGRSDEPLVADHPEVPAEHALQGFDGVCAYTSEPRASAALLEALHFERPRDRGRREAIGGDR